MTLDPAHVAWCQSMMSMIAERGFWEVPRAMTTYQRRGNALVRITLGPCPDRAVPDDEWRQYQKDDYANIKQHFEAAGFEVHDEVSADSPLIGR